VFGHLAYGEQARDQHSHRQSQCEDVRNLENVILKYGEDTHIVVDEIIYIFDHVQTDEHGNESKQAD
jgi:hypothetical protein